MYWIPIGMIMNNAVKSQPQVLQCGGWMDIGNTLYTVEWYLTMIVHETSTSRIYLIMSIHSVNNESIFYATRTNIFNIVCVRLLQHFIKHMLDASQIHNAATSFVAVACFINNQWNTQRLLNRTRMDVEMMALIKITYQNSATTLKSFSWPEPVDCLMRVLHGQNEYIGHHRINGYHELYVWVVIMDNGNPVIM